MTVRRSNSKNKSSASGIVLFVIFCYWFDKKKQVCRVKESDKQDKQTVHRFHTIFFLCTTLYKGIDRFLLFLKNDRFVFKTTKTTKSVTIVLINKDRLKKRSFFDLKKTVVFENEPFLTIVNDLQRKYMFLVWKSEVSEHSGYLFR